MKYAAVEGGIFLQRDNRFVAQCQLKASQEMVKVHVKNTGRSKELLLPGVEVALNYQAGPQRKTAYDLIAVKKGDQWVNIDSQIPNALVATALREGEIVLPDFGEITYLKREYTYGKSKFDIYLEDANGEKAFVEVKGMTLENHQIGAFPDAPSVRGLKHVKELTQAKTVGYHSYLIFVVQLEGVKKATIHTEMQPELTEAFQEGIEKGVQVLAYTCEVTAGTIKIKERIPFEADYPFIDPNKI